MNLFTSEWVEHKLCRQQSTFLRISYLESPIWNALHDSMESCAPPYGKLRHRNCVTLFAPMESCARPYGKLRTTLWKAVRGPPPACSLQLRNSLISELGCSVDGSAFTDRLPETAARLTRHLVPKPLVTRTFSLAKKSW